MKHAPTRKNGLGYKALIMDIGDVLFTWSAATKTSISAKTLKKIISSSIWFDYECGRISEDVCYVQVGERFNLRPEEVSEAFAQARDSLRPSESMIVELSELKAKSNGGLRVYAMSNISKPDYAVLSTKTADWSVFDRVFTSGDAGMRKPNLNFYYHVLKEIRTIPQDIIFVDDKFENVFSARSIGIHGIVFDDTANVVRTLRNLLGDPLYRGKEYLSRNAGNMSSTTECNTTIHDNFAQLLILSTTEDGNLVKLEAHPRTWNFFIGKPLLTTESFPNDLDTTSLALMVIDYDDEVVSSVLDEMLEYVNEDGIIMTYFDHSRPRVDPIVCTNVLSLFYEHGRGNQLRKTLDWVHEVLIHRAYTGGTRYYSSADCFLFFLGRLIDRPYHPDLHDRLVSPLKERLQERVGTNGDALSLAMRIITCKKLGLRYDTDMRSLLNLQREDGGWKADWIYQYGGSGLRIGNRGLTTAFAVKALEGHCVESLKRGLSMDVAKRRKAFALSFGLARQLKAFFE